jgi:hypothetical protein
MIKITEQSLARTIADLLVKSEDSANPNLEHNAYNWGLIDAERAIRGVSVDIIKEGRPK